jgi:hypothetical protein
MSYRIQRLLTVKSIVTILLTVGFLILSLTSSDVPSVFAEVYKMIVIFYFGTQAGAKDNAEPTQNNS